MGCYLSEPVTEKISADEESDKLSCGHSSMQGWRISQEDAHNCILGFDSNTALFAVYDGHGGHEVAQYTSQKLPDFIKETEAYKSGDMEKALVDSFLGFDSKIATENVIAELKLIAGDKEAVEENSDDEENVNYLYEEAAMPLEQVIEKYKSNVLNPHLKNLQKTDENKPHSPFLKARREEDGKPGGSGHKSAFAVCSPSSSSSSAQGSSGETSNDAVSSSSGVMPKNANGEKAESSCSSEAAEATPTKNIEGESPSKSVPSQNNEETPQKVETSSAEAASKPEVSSNSITPGSMKMEVTDNNNSEDKSISDEKMETPDSSVDQIGNSTKSEHQNGEIEGGEQVKNEHVSSTCSPQENGGTPRKGKGKALTKTKGVAPPKLSKNLRPKRTSNQLYSTLLDFQDCSEEESEDEEDKTFEGPQDLDDSDDSDDAEKTNEGADGDDEEEEEEIEDEEDDEEDREECDEFARNMREEPGSDSGCTAVVALLRGNELFVANAGDSRCIICRNGTAIEMSFDHKPEDAPERQRVVKAGGKVTLDGRVNGGLNLSRAIGDHAYKQNKELSDREQMITALPDVRKTTINPGEDEFMVLACDGIWNFMSSQEVVEFVRPRLQEKVKLSQICEEMFDHCLAPNSMGDGTGCDNMTAIIVQFKPNILKRSATPETSEDGNSKRAKTEEIVQVESTA